MNKIKVHEFPLGIYPRMIWIAVTKENKFEGFSELSNIDESCDAVVDNAHDDVNDKGGIFIRFISKKVMTTDVIAHEACHAAMEVLAYIGGRVDLNNQEYFCYLVQYIARCCQKVKDNNFD